jgi:hypothetical protein
MNIKNNHSFWYVFSMNINIPLDEIIEDKFSKGPNMDQICFISHWPLCDNSSQLVSFTSKKGKRKKMNNLKEIESNTHISISNTNKSRNFFCIGCVIVNLF